MDILKKRKKISSSGSRNRQIPELTVEQTFAYDVCAWNIA
jgi:hypothetical protein